MSKLVTSIAALLLGATCLLSIAPSAAAAPDLGVVPYLIWPGLSPVPYLPVVDPLSNQDLPYPVNMVITCPDPTPEGQIVCAEIGQAAPLANIAIIAANGAGNSTVDFLNAGVVGPANGAGQTTFSDYNGLAGRLNENLRQAGEQVWIVVVFAIDQADSAIVTANAACMEFAPNAVRGECVLLTPVTAPSE